MTGDEQRRIDDAVDRAWLKSVEILPMTDAADVEGLVKRWRNIRLALQADGDLTLTEKSDIGWIDHDIAALSRLSRNEVIEDKEVARPSDGATHLPPTSSESVEQLRAAKDGAYLERNQVVAALALLFPSGIARTDIPGWLPEWHGCVYIDLPTGQVSWHYHDSHAHLFAHLPPYTGKWDRHSTEEKYARVAALQDATITCHVTAPAVRPSPGATPNPPAEKGG